MKRAVMTGGLVLLAVFLLLVAGLWLIPREGPYDLPSADWRFFEREFITSEGRVVDTGNGGISHSEGQGYGMLIAEAYGKRHAFERIWKWTRENLQTRPKDKLLSWKWVPDARGGGKVSDPNNASDADLLVAWALVRAAARWSEFAFSQAALEILVDLRRLDLVEADGQTWLLPGTDGFRREHGIILNPSYYIFRAFSEIDRAFPGAGWAALDGPGRRMLEAARFGEWSLSPEWVLRKEDGSFVLPDDFPPDFGYNAVRVPLYLAWDNPKSPLLEPFAAFWKSFSELDKVPATVNLKTNLPGPDPALQGMRDVAKLTMAAAKGEVLTVKDIALIGEGAAYYSACLTILVKMAVRETWAGLVMTSRVLMALACGLLTVGHVSAQPAMPIPDPAQAPTPEPTPSLFVPVQPGFARPTPVRPPFSTPFPRATPEIRTPVPAATPTPTSATSVPLFVPSDVPASEVPVTTPTLEPPSDEDFIPGEMGPDLSEPRPLRDPAEFDFEPLEVTSTPTPKPIPKPARQAATTPRPRQASRQEQSVAPSQQQLSSWVMQANKTQDAALATRIGWGFYNADDLGSAGIWFSQALDWNPKLGEAAYGLALTKFREGDLSSAEAIVNVRRDSYPKMNSLEADIYVRRGLDYYSMRRYGQSLEFMQKAAALRPLTRNEQIILAWNYYYTKNYQESAAMFERLYAQGRDEQSAQGLYSSLSKLQDYEQLDRLATAGGPLKEVYATYEARQYYEAGLYRASADVGGQLVYPELVNLNGPSAAFGLGYRTKSGTEGEGQLSTGILPIIQGQFSPAEKTIISGWLKRITLDAGTLAPGARVGLFPRQFTQYAFEPETEFNNLWEFGIGFAYIDWWSFYFNLSTTPQNGPLSARPTGNAGIIYRDLQGYVQAEIYGRSIQESLLSYVGMRDPYSGRTWGRVIETGGSLSVFRSIGGNNTIFAKASYGWIDGTEVEDNTHFAAVVAVAHEFKVRGFEFVTLGPAVSYESFENNQNFFTFGHGGYFSPQSMLQGIIQVQFLTEEGKRWLAGGMAGAGVQSNEQNGAPFFPLDPDGRNYGSQSSTTGIGLINLTGGYLINPNWMVGGSAGFNVTADYNEGFFNVWVRYYFERRNGLVRDDLGLQGLTPIY